MDPLNLVKIITTIATAVVALFVGLRVLFLNKRDWLNRWFFLFFISSSLGFLFYATYHLILSNPDIIIPLMITAQIFFNLNSISLVMTVFVIDKYSKAAMSFKYLGTMIILFVVMSIGYFIFPPYLDMGDYALGIVNTHTPPGLLIFVNGIRILLAIYAVIRYFMITKRIEGATKNRMKWISTGVLIVILGLLFNLTGSLLSMILIEILALITIAIGALLVFRGFLIKS